MKRRALPIRILLFLLLGAIVNVAVAWGWAVTGVKDSGEGGPIAPTSSEWPQVAQTSQELTDFAVGIARNHAVVREYLFARGAQDGLSSEGTIIASKMKAGWPSRSVYSEESVESSTYRAGPVWPGFAINTLFYAGILWVMFAAPFALRGRKRIKHGLCPACAYPVGESEVCTECGTPHTLTPRNRPAAAA